MSLSPEEREALRRLIDRARRAEVAAQNAERVVLHALGRGARKIDS